MSPTPRSLPLDSSAIAQERPFLAADVGGTHVRIGLIRSRPRPGQPIVVVGYRKFVSAEFASLTDIFATFLAGLGGEPVAEAAIACAGYPLADGSLITVNLPWPISPAEIRETLGLQVIRVVNDFEAVAHAAEQMGENQVLHLAGPSAAGSGPTLVLGPGTGFGAAVWMPDRDRPTVLATEAGQAALTVSSEQEIALLRELSRGRSHVPVESALSGPGLLNLHNALCRLHGHTSSYRSPRDITAAAVSGADPAARASLDAFCGLLGSTVGNLALLYGIRGSIYLAGGILPQIRDFLRGSPFVERMLDKGAMRDALERIPVKLVEHGQLGVIGAARWYLDRREDIR